MNRVSPFNGSRRSTQYKTTQIMSVRSKRNPMTFPYVFQKDKLFRKPCLSVGRLGILVLFLAAFLFHGLDAHAQFETASVLGYIRDSSGAVVPEAKVILTNLATNVKQTATSDNEGKYEFSSVRIGEYQISTEAPGFQGARTEKFTVTTNARQRVDVTLQTGSVTTTVEVTAAAQMLESETSSRGQVVGTREVENLPLNGRSYADLTLLVPGVRKSALENNGTTTSREGSFNINGQRSAFNNFLLDGLDNNNYGTSNQGFENENISPSPDAVSEFRVETNNYAAEYGRSSGGVINASIRRGTNQFHGSAWDYVRNTSFNAIGPFLAVGATKPKFIRNQFGGAFGGPVWKDHTFFFGDYEGMRQIFNNAAATSTLPTANQRNGLFYLNDDTTNANNAIPLKNPITGKTYLGSIPQSDMTQFAKAVLTALPSPTASGLANNYTITPRGTINDDKGDGRIDHTFNNALSIFGRYSEHQEVIFDPPSIAGRAGGNSNGNVSIKNRAIAAGATWTISGTKLLDVRFGWSKNEGGKFPIGQGQSSLLVENGITDGLPTDPNVVRSLNAQSVTGYNQFGAQSSNPQFQNPTIYNPKANFTWIKAKHSFKLGYEYQAVNTQVNDFNPSYGQDNYGGLYASNGNPVNTVVTGSATLASQLQLARNLADFMFGNRSSYSLTNYVVVNLRQRFNFMYFQDDIKVSPNLAVNAGIRYELATPQWERDNKLANFDPRTNSLVQAGKGDIYDRAQVNLPVKNIGPRLGFAYSIDPKTVFRGGYGISFTQWNRAGGENNLTYNGPNVVNATINQITPTATSLCTNDTQVQSNCFRQTQQGYSQFLTSAAYFNPLNVTTRYIPRNFSTGYVQSYHLGFQRELPGGFVTELAYVGNKSTHLQILADYNQGAPCVAATGVTCGSLQARRPISNFGSIEIAYGGGSANYNSLQFKVERRATVGLYLLNSFTYSRGFDLSSGHLETSGGDNSRVNYANPSQDYGPSGYDQPLADTASIVYDLPYGHGRRFGASSGRLVNTALGGWQLTLINTMTSGFPVNITYSLASSSSLYGSGLVTYRPSRVAGGGVITAPSSNHKKTATALTGYFTSANLVNPTTYPWGNVSRNSQRSNAYYQADLGLHKAFPLWSDSSNLDFRAEAFNVLNKVNYAQADGTFGASTFGSITTAFPARQLQLAAKIIF